MKHHDKTNKYHKSGVMESGAIYERGIAYFCGVNHPRFLAIGVESRG